MGSPNERAATEEPPVAAGPAAGRSISVPVAGAGGTLAAHQQQQQHDENQDQDQQQEEEQLQADNTDEIVPSSSKIQPAAAAVVHHSHSDSNGNSGGDDPSPTAASNGTTAAVTSMEWNSSSLKSPNLVNPSSTCLPWMEEDEEGEPEVPEVSVTPSRRSIRESSEEEEDEGQPEGSPPVSPPSVSRSRSSSVGSVSVASCSTGGDPEKQEQDHYCLRWTNHGSHVLSVFAQLLRDESLVDVTLSAEGRSVRAHKMILSACSSFFRTLLIQHADQRHPIIILKDTKFEELESLIQFMYKGEVSVEYGQLATLLKTAENLRVKGLAEVVNSATAAIAAAASTKTTTSGLAAAANNNDGDDDDDGGPIVIERSALMLSAAADSRRHRRHSRHQHQHPYRRSGSRPTNHHRGMALDVDSPLLADQLPAEDLSAQRQRLNRGGGEWTAQPQTPPSPPPPSSSQQQDAVVAPLGPDASRHRPHRHRDHNSTSRHHQATRQLLLDSKVAVALDTSPPDAPDAPVVDITLIGSGGRHNPDDNDHNHRFKADASPRNGNTTTAVAAAGGGATGVMQMTSPPPLALINESMAQDLRRRPNSSLGSSSPLPSAPSVAATALVKQQQQQAPHHRFHPWMMDESEESGDDEMDVDDDAEEEEDEAYRHQNQRRTLKPTNHSPSGGRRPWATSERRQSIGPPQHHPMVFTFLLLLINRLID